MKPCDCNKGFGMCNCEQYGTLERHRGVDVVLVVATVLIAGLYLFAKYLIGG